MLSLQLYILLFADDVAMIASDLVTLRALFDAFKTYCMLNCLNISEKKTKVLVNEKGFKGESVKPGEFV